MSLTVCGLAAADRGAARVDGPRPTTTQPSLPYRDVDRCPRRPRHVDDPAADHDDDRHPADRRSGTSPAPYTRVVSTDDGIVLAVAEDPLAPLPAAHSRGRRRSPSASARAGWSPSTSARRSGRIVVNDAQAEHEVFPAGTGPRRRRAPAARRRLRRRPGLRARVTSYGGIEPSGLGRAARPARPRDTAADRPRERGGWEEGVGSARLLPNGDVVVLREPLRRRHELERRRLDGTTAWSLALPGDQSRSMTLHHSGDHLEHTSVAVLEPSPGTATAIPASPCGRWTSRRAPSCRAPVPAMWPTNVPLPWRRTISPVSSSRRSAVRRVPRETPSIEARSCSGGRRSPSRWRPGASQLRSANSAPSTRDGRDAGWDASSVIGRPTI